MAVILDINRVTHLVWAKCSLKQPESTVCTDFNPAVRDCLFCKFACLFTKPPIFWQKPYVSNTNYKLLEAYHSWRLNLNMSHVEKRVKKYLTNQWTLFKRFEILKSSNSSKNVTACLIFIHEPEVLEIVDVLLIADV